MQNNFLFLALKLLVLVAICLKTAKAQTPADTLPINNSIVVTGKANSYVPKISVGTLIQFEYAYQLPIMDMGKRFGNNSNIGLTILQKTGKNWFYGINGQFLFGFKLREDSLAWNLFAENGQIWGRDGLPADVVFAQRGYMGGMRLGKLFPLNPVKNPNMGIMVSLEGGYFEHRIRIFDRYHQVPALEGNFNKGYDRLTKGFFVGQSVGFLYLDPKRLKNIYVGAHLYEGFTQPQRAFNFDTQHPDLVKNRKDWLVGFKAALILPLYRTEQQKRYYTR